jgi:iron complex outermembrane receptor protein
MNFSTFLSPANRSGCVNILNRAINYFYRIDPATKRKFIMRAQLLAVLLFAFCIQLSAATSGQNITLTEKNASLQSVLNKIEQQSGYDVFLQTELLSKSTKVSITAKNQTLQQVLDKVFKQQPLTYSLVGHTIVLKDKLATPAITAGNTAFAGIITGKIVDADTKEPLVGATVTVKGTSTAVSTGLDGSFKLNTSGVENATLVISYIGYVSKEVAVGDRAKLGEITLKSSENGMSEVVINGDNAIDRKTPVAVSTVGAQFIEEHLGTQDIPELLKGIPGVMATAQGGGYGDSRVSIRGFSSKSGNGNVALTINGIPVSDPETGAIFWSDFTGIADVTSSIQVQRGLGASKIIVPSFGGTINITTRSTDMQKGGFVSETIGSDGFNRTDVLVSTGLNANGWAATFQGGRVQGNGFADGLNFLGYNYFFNLSKVLSPNQTISFNLVGATQTHGQRMEEPIADYQQAPQGIRWNYEAGVKDGKQFNPYNNTFSEPIFSINHDWTINSTSSLSTVLYAIIGSGGAGEIGGAAAPRVGNLFTPFDYSAVEKSNAANVDGSSSTYLYSSHNTSDFYGIKSTYKTLLGKYIDLSAGIDLRYYKGTHYEDITDPLGGNFVDADYSGNPALGTAKNDINNPIHNAVTGDKFGFYNVDNVLSGGVFAQAEYSKKDFTAFATVSGSEQGDRRQDLFNYLNTDPAQTSRYVDFTTYQAKIGANYNLTSQMNLFANIGYLTKPPYFANVFENFTNQINKNSVTEKLFSYELGYGFKSAGFSAKLNLYRTSYMDRADAVEYTDPTTQTLSTVNISGVNEIHQGVELELKYTPIKDVYIGGSASIGDFYYNKNAGPATELNAQGGVVGTVSQVFLKGMKVGDVAQTTAAGFAEFQLLKQLKVGVIYNYWGNYTSFVPFQNITSANLHPYVIPNFSTWDLNATFKFKMAGFDASLIGTVNNVLNTKYISDAEDVNASGLASNVNVYYGLGRTFTTGLKVKF